MEHDALENPVYLPISVKKDGTITDGVASAHQLGRLGKYTEYLLRRGNVDADPISRSPQDTACRWCAYASACYFRDGVGSDRRRYLKKTSPADFWQNIEDKLGKEAHHD